MSALHDADKFAHEGTITLTGNRITSKSMKVSVVDDEDTDVRLDLPATSQQLDEGESEPFRVRLRTQPGRDRVVTLTSTTDSIRFNRAKLTFTSTDWDTYQSVSVTAIKDDDSLNETGTVRLSGDGVISASVETSVTDNDIGLIVSPTSLTVDEGGTATFTVKLAEQPGRDRTVALKSSSKKVTFDTDPDEEGIQTQLTFTAGEDGDWDEPQTVRVTAAQDDDGNHESATLTLSGTRVVTSSVAVAVTDDDVALSLSATSLTIDEGRSKTFTVRLTKNSSANVTVTLVRSGDTDIKIGTTPASLGSKTTLNFTSSNWQTPQNVTVKGEADDDYIDDNATINLTAVGAGILPVSAKVSVIDDEDADVGLKLWNATKDKNNNRIAEGGTLMFRVSLDAQPKNDRVIDLTLSGDNTSAVTLSTARLIFTPGNWSIAQAVTITAAKDHNRDDETVTFNLSGTRIVGSPRTESITVLDNNAYNKLILDKTWLGLDEGADLKNFETIRTFTVRMSSSWSIDRTVTLEPSGLHVKLEPSSLTFTLKDWYIPQTVKVGAESDDKKGNRSSRITIKDGDREEEEEGVLRTTSLMVQVQDPKYIGADLSPTTLSVNEGRSKTFKVWVTDEPYANRTVRLDVSGGGQNAPVTLDKTVLTFTPFNWNTPQTVTVSADQDADANGGAVTIRPQFRVINSAGDYEWVNADSPSLTVSVVDDDDSGGTGLNVSGVLRNLNGDDAGSLTVSLAASPGNDRTDSLQILRHSNLMLDPDRIASGSLSSLALNADDWSAPQAATVRAKPVSDKVGNMIKVNFTDTCPVDVLPFKAAAGAGMDSARNFSAIPPPAEGCGRAILSVRRFSPSPGKAGMSP
ncbi:MAG: hypothetical protein ISN29_07905 [Gammaproteobacteria bacterium AqS3]|nr:hypothetical protein [Gammaproteobacteria bacterium AqS3]